MPERVDISRRAFIYGILLGLAIDTLIALVVLWLT